MNINIGKNTWKILIALLAMTGAMAYCAMPVSPPALAGVVIDVSTNQPMEGVYVMAVYRQSGGTLFGHGGSWCVRTAGMYTGKDGAFHFPAEKSSRAQAYAIKPDYFTTRDYADIKRPSRVERTWFGEEREIPDPNIYLKPQDPVKPNFPDHHSCERPQTRGDVAANVEHFNLYMIEQAKYFPELYRASKNDSLETIQQWKSLPEKPEIAK